MLPSTSVAARIYFPVGRPPLNCPVVAIDTSKTSALVPSMFSFAGFKPCRKPTRTAPRQYCARPKNWTATPSSWASLWRLSWVVTRGRQTLSLYIVIPLFCIPLIIGLFIFFLKVLKYLLKKKFLQGHGIIKSGRVLFGGISKRSEFLGDIIKLNFLKMSQSSPPPYS